MSAENSIKPLTGKRDVNPNYLASTIFAEAANGTITPDEMAELLIERLNPKLPMITIVDDLSRFSDFIETSRAIIKIINSSIELPPKNIFLAMSNLKAGFNFFSSGIPFATAIYSGTPEYIYSIAKKMREINQPFVCVIDWNLTPMLIRKRMGNEKFENFNIITFLDNLKKLNPNIEIIIWTASPQAAEEALLMYAENTGIEADIKVVSKIDATYDEIAGALLKALVKQDKNTEI